VGAARRGAVVDDTSCRRRATTVLVANGSAIRSSAAGLSRPHAHPACRGDHPPRSAAPGRPIALRLPFQAYSAGKGNLNG
jgi:hypothetical protein